MVTAAPATLAPSISSAVVVTGWASFGPSTVSERVVTEAIRSAPSPKEMPVLTDSATVRTAPPSSSRAELRERVPDTWPCPWSDPSAVAAPSAAVAASP